jgi:basic membrane protein A
MVALLAATVLVGGGAASTGRSGPITVGLVFQNTAIDDPYQRGVLVGLRRAVRELGVRAKTIASPPNQSSLGAFRYLAQHRYDLILTYGFLQTADLDQAALQFPDRTFAIVDASIRDLKHRPKNVQGAHFETQQAAYLAGYLAALLERRRSGRDVLGSVGGFAIPTVDAYIAGYQAGARKAAPEIRLLNGYSHSFGVPAKCRAVALNQIAHGAGAIFDVAASCGLGALAAAKQKHVWGIGVDVDQSSLGPHILTSVTKRLDVAVFDTIKAYKDGQLRSGSDAVFDLKNGGVGLGRFSPRVPRALIARLEPIRKQIVAGTIRVPARLSAR